MEAFTSKYTVQSDGCWIWRAATDQAGYGVFRNQRAHRVSYKLAGGVIPDGYVLDHRCKVRSCVNPDHCEPMTIAENIAWGERALTTQCPAGHLYTTENTYSYTTKEGRHRRCRACHAARMRSFRAEQRQRLHGVT